MWPAGRTARATGKPASLWLSWDPPRRGGNGPGGPRLVAANALRCACGRSYVQPGSWRLCPAAADACPTQIRSQSRHRAHLCWRSPVELCGQSSRCHLGRRRGRWRWSRKRGGRGIGSRKRLSVSWPDLGCGVRVRSLHRGSWGLPSAPPCQSDLPCKWSAHGGRR